MADAPDIAALRADMRAKAEKATPGVWYHRQAEPVNKGDLSWIADDPRPGRHTKIIIGRFSTYGGRADYAHIAASCPAHLIAVLDADAAEIARLTEELSGTATWLEGLLCAEKTRAEDAESRVAELEAELARLKGGEAPAGMEDEALPSGHPTQAYLDEVSAILARAPEATGSPPLVFSYRNHRGEVDIRRARPISTRFGATDWHPEPQWLLRAFDLDKQAEREFAMRDMTSVSASDTGGSGG